MAFKYEKISDEDRKKYKINELHFGQGENFRSWIIDREKETFLVRTGLNQEYCTTFYVNYGGGVSTINGERKKGSSDHEFNYYINNIQFFKNISDSKDKIINLLQEMLEFELKANHLNKNTITITLPDSIKNQIDGN